MVARQCVLAGIGYVHVMFNDVYFKIPLGVLGKSANGGEL